MIFISDPQIVLSTIHVSIDRIVEQEWREDEQLAFTVAAKVFMIWQLFSSIPKAALLNGNHDKLVKRSELRWINKKCGNEADEAFLRRHQPLLANIMKIPANDSEQSLNLQPLQAITTINQTLPSPADDAPC